MEFLFVNIVVNGLDNFLILGHGSTIFCGGSKLDSSRMLPFLTFDFDVTKSRRFMVESEFGSYFHQNFW